MNMCEDQINILIEIETWILIQRELKLITKLNFRKEAVFVNGRDKLSVLSIFKRGVAEF